MSFQAKLKHELKSVLLTTLYFALWFGTLVAIKKLILADYKIPYKGLSIALIGALIMAKVVLLMEYVPLGKWIEKRPPIVDVIVRTLIYGFAVFLVLILEKSFEARHEFGGFLNALTHIGQHPDYPHITTPDQNGTNGSVKMTRKQFVQQNSTNQDMPQWPTAVVGTNLPANNAKVAPVNENPSPIAPPAKK